MKISRCTEEAETIATYLSMRRRERHTHTHIYIDTVYIYMVYIIILYFPRGSNQLKPTLDLAPSRLAMKQGQALAEEQASLFMADTWS